MSRIKITLFNFHGQYCVQSSWHDRSVEGAILCMSFVILFNFISNFILHRTNPIVKLKVDNENHNKN